MDAVNSTLQQQQLLAAAYVAVHAQTRAIGFFSQALSNISIWQVLLTLLLGAVVYDQGKSSPTFYVTA